MISKDDEFNDDFDDEFGDLGDIDGELNELGEEVDDISGYYDDDGNKLNPDLVPKPALCISCALDDNPAEEMLCTLNRLDQQDEETFKCGMYKRKM